MNPDPTEDLIERIHRLLDGEMEAHELAKLDAELRNDPEARKIYIETAALHSALQVQFSSQAELSRTHIIPIDRLLARQQKRIIRFASLATAAILMISAIVLWSNFSARPTSLARFETCPDGQYTLTLDGKPQSANQQTIQPGSRLKLTAGTVEATLSSGVRCIVDAPCDMVFHSEKLISLTEGTGLFHVPHATNGFTVQTRHLEVVDLGTEFGIVAQADGSDEVHVTQGSVRASARNSNKKSQAITLKANQAYRVDGPGNLVKTFFNESRFPRQLSRPLVIKNADFDIIPTPTKLDDARGYGPIQGWATSGHGVGLNTTSQPFLRRSAHSGTQVAFIQGVGLISQTISGFDPTKTYSITYFVNERGLPDASTRTSASLDLGSTVYVHPDLIRETDAFRRIVSSPLTVFGPSANIEIRAMRKSADATLLVDSVSISRSVPAIPDGGFEMAVLPDQAFVQHHKDSENVLKASSWIFDKGAGIVHNRSPFQNPLAPEGSQAAVLQGTGAGMKTSLVGFEQGVTYRLHLSVAARSQEAASLKLELGSKPLLFGKSATLKPTAHSYETFVSEPFQATKATEELHIQALSQGSVFIDDLYLEFISEAE